ncbi:hypothetical protein [Alistipes sp.]|uniref:hypothetical protein n=1 Tax=Alistipes sp. TaxID=1872444 RepID=UPI003AF19C48
MLIEHVELERKRGVGDVVLLALLLFPSIVALVRLFARGQTKLRNTAKVRLFGKIPFGGAVLWGGLIFGWGCLLLAAFASIETKDAADWWLCWLVLVPTLLTGFWLMVYGVAYSSYVKAVEAMLVKIAREGELCPGDLDCTLGGVRYKTEQTVAMLEDLRENGIVAYDDLGGGNYKIWLVDPALAALAPSCDPQRKGAPQTAVPEKSAWTCPACGAPNVSAEDGMCEYCGGGRKAL